MPIETVTYHFVTCDQCDRPFRERPDEDSVHDIATAERAGWVIFRDVDGQPEGATCPKCQGRPRVMLWTEAYDQAFEKCNQAIAESCRFVEIRMFVNGGYQLAMRSESRGYSVRQPSDSAVSWATKIADQMARLHLCDTRS